MKKLLLLVVFLFCMASASFAEIKVCRWVDSPLKQVESRFLKSLEERTGEKIVVGDFPWATFADFFEKGEKSAIVQQGGFQVFLGCLSNTRAVPHSEAYGITYNKILSKLEDSIDKFKNLNGKEVGVDKGSFAEELLPKRVPHALVIPTETKNIADLVNILRAGLLDAIVADDVVLEPFGDEFYISNEKVEPVSVVVYFSQGGTKYVDIMNEIIEEYLLDAD